MKKYFIFQLKIIINILFQDLIIIFLPLFFILIEIKIKNSLLISEKSPKISIFLPIFNKEEFLFRSIGSIQNQTLKNIEIVAVNDGSTDNSLKILKEFSKKDSRIKIINNDRNHGLLYSRAMGILNSTGEYVMNLDPDDKLKDRINLEQLYNETNNSKFDLIIFLIERISSYYKENYYTFLENKLQLQKPDYRITNKLIKRKIILKAYKYYCTYIHRNRWNYHEDNIWNILVRKFTKNTKIFNNYIYIYKRNKDSLNSYRGNIMDIKNRIYRMKLLIQLYKKFKKLDYYNLYYFYNDIILTSNASLLNKEKDIKKEIFRISYELLDIFKNKNNIYKSIIKALNQISQNKIILFINSYQKVLTNYLSNLSILKFLKQNYCKSIISIDINNNTQIYNIFNYIYSNDMIVGMDNIIFLPNFKKLLNHFYNNTILLFTNDLFINKTLINSKNLIIHSFTKK